MHLRLLANLLLLKNQHTEVTLFLRGATSTCGRGGAPSVLLDQLRGLISEDDNFRERSTVHLHLGPKTRCETESSMGVAAHIVGASGKLL